MSTDLIAETVCSHMLWTKSELFLNRDHHHQFSVASTHTKCQSLLLLIQGKWKFSAPKRPHIHLSSHSFSNQLSIRFSVHISPLNSSEIPGRSEEQKCHWQGCSRIWVTARKFLQEGEKATGQHSTEWQLRNIALITGKGADRFLSTSADCK